MIISDDLTIRPDSPTANAQPIFPTTPTEYVNALSHFYRGELARMVSWRDRLDRTTNWAITGVGAMLSVSLSSPETHHGVLLFAMVLIFLLLSIESRRYRFFHVYRSRVRLIERNYYARIFSPREHIDPTHWMNQLSEDLRLPRFSNRASASGASKAKPIVIGVSMAIASPRSADTASSHGAPPALSANPKFRGYVVFLLNPPR